MSESNKTYRIRTKINSKDDKDRYININLDNDIDILEILSLKLDTKNFYKTQTSNYGCIVGRVLANGGVGIPNAKISVFINADNTDSDSVLSALYPYEYVQYKNDDGIRYNLLPEEQVSECHTPIGSFPSKRMVLDDDNVIEIFDKYYKFTTRTNDSGDYMIFGVPVGDATIHTDIDLSDIGMLSQRPRDMIYKGYNITQFENANKFKKDSNIDNLTQVISQNDSVNVYPFWGDENLGEEIKITRNDINVQYKFEPTCIFLGSMISDEKSQYVSKKCIATDNMGKMDKLTTGSGTIEMIRKTIDDEVEEKQIQGNELIDGNGTWCYQIPMNLDYYMTDEYGNFVPSDDKEKGIPTRARVRFRFSLTDFESDYSNTHLVKVLVPNNPKKYEDLSYEFGSLTKDDEFATKGFRDLFWNNIYTVKQYIPRLQQGNRQRNNRFTGIKNINVNGGNNPIPYNNLRVNLTFMFTLQCALLKMMIKVITFINKLKKFKSSDKKCTTIGEGVCTDLENWYFAPGCPAANLGTTLEIINEGEAYDTQSIDYNNSEGTDNVCITKQITYLMQCIEINLAMEYNVIQFDFYNDWINGLIYIPRWNVNIRKKRSFFFGLIKTRGKTSACMESQSFGRSYVQQCALGYNLDENKNYTIISNDLGCKNNKKQKCHKKQGRHRVKALSHEHMKHGGGLVHVEETLQQQKVYYFKPCEWHDVSSSDNEGKRCILFATDIVLLGNLNECNEDGIPQTFSDLTSSTYVMPSNLAQTNMDTQSFMYGHTSNGVRCSSSNPYKDVVTAEQTFENSVEWEKNDGEYDGLQTAEDYAVTEASGIDWGYSGPNQGKNNLSNLYFPGGHFLGISCTNAEVNIKSCVNLSRICEFGSTLSQRQQMLSLNGSQIKPQYFIPNGLISRYEITDSDFRKVFATLNSNGLRTKRDENTKYLKYDFRYLYPTNFDGGLNKRINSNNTDYNWNGYDDEVQTVDSETIAYRKLAEQSSIDYYYFRFGLDNEMSEEELSKEKRNKFLSFEKNSAFLPMYENSYYFYFGLKDGNTAIDRFYKDYYAKCSNDNDYGSFFKIEEIGRTSCADDDGGINVSITNVEPPYTISLKKRDKISDEQLYLNIDDNGIKVVSSNTNGAEILTYDKSKFKLYGMTVGKYVLTLGADGMSTVDKEFSVNNYSAGYLTSIEITSNNFKASSYNETSNLLNMEVGIRLLNINTENIKGFLIANDEKYIYKSLDKKIPESAANIVPSQFLEYIDYTYLTNIDVEKVAIGYSVKNNLYNLNIPVWKGNDTYYIYVSYNCDGNLKIAHLQDVYISMPIDFDLEFGDGDLTTKNANLNITDSNWYKNIFKNEDSKLSEKQLWNLKETLFYRASLYQGQKNGKINVEPIGYKGKITESIQCNAEKVTFNDDDYNANFSIDNFKSSSNGNDISIKSFYFPTSYFNENEEVINYSKNGYIKSYCNDKTKYNGLLLPTNVKEPYEYNVKDSKGGSLFGNKYGYLPSIYRPFYCTAIKLIDMSKGNVNYLIAVNNAITYNGKINEIRVNNKKYNDKIYFDESFKGDTTNYITISEKYDTSSLISNGDESFSVLITEGSPSSNYNGGIIPTSIDCSRSAHFPCDEDDFDFYYSNGIRFYHCSPSNFYVMVNNDKLKNNANNVIVEKNNAIEISNVNINQDVKIHLKNDNGDEIIMSSKNIYNPLKEDITKNGQCIVNEKNKKEYNINNTDTYKYFECIVNKNDVVNFTSTIDFTFIKLNNNGEVVGSTKIDEEERTFIYDSTKNNTKKTVNIMFNGKILISYANKINSHSQLIVEVTHNSYAIKTPKNQNGLIFSHTLDDSFKLGYIEVNENVIYSAKINGELVQRIDGIESNTNSYLQLIRKGVIGKDYSNGDSYGWNSIFGNSLFTVLEDTDELTLQKIEEYANKHKISKWEAFNSIITNVIKADVFALIDEWTNINDIENEDNKKIYSKEHKDIWNNVVPDTNSIGIVRYYPMNLLNN